MKDLITTTCEDNFRIYGARKFWRELNRRSHMVVRCTIERLMRELGITGAVCGRHVVTTVTDPSAVATKETHLARPRYPGDASIAARPQRMSALVGRVDAPRQREHRVHVIPASRAPRHHWHRSIQAPS
ncbi:IS3 family transposase [Kitasatospora fiedleri]|uniref:IS3 family transposase n=1 Tax=Kitasatospora fiedleri TaxID=2991545 RepID=UPI00385094D4